MSGAWSKPLVTREPTEEEREQQRQRDAERREEERQKALMAAGNRLMEKVERLIDTRDGGVSSNYGSDEQYGVTGSYNSDVVNMAFYLWKQHYGNAQVRALNIHKLGPRQKFTGGRGGISQYNFIRKISDTGSGRFNIHVDWSGK